MKVERPARTTQKPSKETPDDKPNGEAEGAPPTEDAAAAAPVEARPGDRHPSTGSIAPGPPRSRILKTIYWFVWFVVAPVVLACMLVVALTPPSGVEHGGILGWVQGIVREQPVPVGIVVFTLFEIALWAARHSLPLARHAHPPLRPDLPTHLRGPFERARALLDEAEMILAKFEKRVVRDLSAKERDSLRTVLEGLRDAMERVPFDEELFVDALVKADNEVDARLGRWRKSEVREYLEAILMATAVAFGLRAFVVEAFKIPSGSMIPTLQVGDHIFVNKFSYGPAIPFTHTRVWTSMPPRRGDVIVFAFPENPDQDFIKRVIAIPGDKLEAKDGHPWLNGWRVPECHVGTYSYTEPPNSEPERLLRSPHHEGDLFVEYLDGEAYLTFYDHEQGSVDEYKGPFLVKPGEVWVMGDNRNNSHDSRFWFGRKGGGVPFDNIRGRALFVWLSVSENGVDWSRFGAPVMGRPRLPPAMSSLEPELSRCLRERPPLEETRPPPAPP